MTQVKLGSNTTCVDYCPLGWNQDCLASASKLIAAKCNGDNSCDNSQIKPTKCDGSDGGWDQFLGRDYVHVDSEMPAVHLDVVYKCLPNLSEIFMDSSTFSKTGRIVVLRILNCKAKGNVVGFYIYIANLSYFWTLLTHELFKDMFSYYYWCI